MPTQPNVAAAVRLFCLVAVNDADDFFLFFLGNSDAFKCLSGSAVGTNQRCSIRSGKGRSFAVFLSAQGAGSDFMVISFHGLFLSC